MKNINGQGNEITIILPHKKIDCISSHHEQFNQIIHQSHIIITGNNNHVSMHFDSEENVEKLLLNEGFLLIIKGNDNTVNLMDCTTFFILYLKSILVLSRWLV